MLNMMFDMSSSQLPTLSQAKTLLRRCLKLLARCELELMRENLQKPDWAVHCGEDWNLYAKKGSG